MSLHNKHEFSVIFLWLGLLINLVLSIWLPNLFSSFLSSFIYILLLSVLFRKNPVPILLLVPIIFLHLSVIISLNAIEMGAYMKELGRWGYVSAASSAFVFLVSIFISVAYSTFNYVQAHNLMLATKSILVKQNLPFIIKYSGLLFMGLMIIYMLGKGAVTGFPLIAGYDRFAYRSSIGDPVMLNFLIMKIIFASFLAVTSLNLSGRKRLLCHFTFVTYIAVSFLFGDKFFVVITTGLFYVALHLVDNQELIQKYLRKFFVLAGAFVLLGLVFTFFIYSGNGSLSFTETFDRVFERFAEQGQLWFVQYNEGFSLIDYNPDEILANIKSFFNKQAQIYAFEQKIGAYYFMPKYAPYQMFMSFERNGGTVTPTMCFEPYYLHLVGFVGVAIVMIIMGIIYGLTVWYIYKAVKSKNPLNIIIPTYILLQLNSTMNTGTIYLIAGVSTLKNILFFTVIIFLIKLVFNKSKKANIV